MSIVSNTEALRANAHKLTGHASAVLRSLRSREAAVKVRHREFSLTSTTSASAHSLLAVPGFRDSAIQLQELPVDAETAFSSEALL